jgi:hypothetical protein
VWGGGGVDNWSFKIDSVFFSSLLDFVSYQSFEFWTNQSEKCVGNTWGNTSSSHNERGVSDYRKPSASTVFCSPLLISLWYHNIPFYICDISKYLLISHYSFFYSSQLLHKRTAHTLCFHVCSIFNSLPSLSAPPFRGILQIKATYHSCVINLRNIFLVATSPTVHLPLALLCFWWHNIF